MCHLGWLFTEHHSGIISQSCYYCIMLGWHASYFQSPPVLAVMLDLHRLHLTGQLLLFLSIQILVGHYSSRLQGESVQA